jgi:hypothetical protein
MSPEGIPGIERLIEEAGKGQELQYGTNQDRLRIDLRVDDIELWQAHRASHPDNANLLLACESGSGELLDTRLTWVVGAAIRPAWVGGSAQAMDLLRTLGVSAQLVELASLHCPGLGESIIWAFHLERHGWLTSTPVQSWT